ncbi:hypothetical protein pb186bvf_013513 [Paramecium bursaria]
MSEYKEETTENEFSEMSDSQVRRRGPQGKKVVEKKQLSPKKRVLPNLIRNVPIVPKSSNFVLRTIYTILMILGFILVLWLGHFYVAILILLINFGIFKEILTLKRDYERENNIPYFFLINWYFFGTAVFFFYGKLFSSKLQTIVNNSTYLSLIFRYHNFISFALWVSGFLMFTLLLKKGYYRYQFRIFGWTHISLLLIVAQSSVMMMNTFEGLVWFILPCSLVIVNDTFAYIFGVSFGKHKLIELSPKKTWEGFLGGCFSTLVASLILTYYLQQYQYLICPQIDIAISPFDTLSCIPPKVFETNTYTLPFSILGFNTLRMSSFQLHSLVLSLFASLVAPFGGFFASGFKRAIKIKDFGDVIPGHGGITDRMDCQILTGMFTYLYLHQIILSQITVATIYATVKQLSLEDQHVLFESLKRDLGY